MKALVWILAIFAAAVGLTLVAKYNTGHVLFVLHPYRVELSLNLLILLVITGFIAGYAFLRLLINTLQLPAQVKAFRERRAQEKARSEMMAALKAFFEGRYAKAEKAAASALKLNESPGINNVVAARSAHELRDYPKRDAYLTLAETNAPEEATLRLMTEAELLLEQHRPAEAIAVLKKLRDQHTAALRLALKAHQQLKNWDEVLELVVQLEKRGALDELLVEQLRCYAHVENLKRKALDAVSLREYWEKIPASEKKQSKIAATAAQAFTSLGGCRAAHEIIEQALESQWDSELVGLYAECLGQDVVNQIERAENWLKSHPDDAALLLTLGKLCARQELWGKAQSYLEASISVEPSHSAHLQLAQLHETMDRPEQATRHYRQSLDLTLNQLKTTTGGRRKPVL